MISNARRSRGFTARLIAGAVTGQSPDEFAEQEYRILACAYCRDGWPLNEEGNHCLLGVVVPCECKPAASDRGGGGTEEETL